VSFWAEPGTAERPEERAVRVLGELAG